MSKSEKLLNSELKIRFMPHEIISWKQIESDINSLAQKLEGNSFSSIYTISRGGLVPSRLIADFLGIEKICVDSPTIPSQSLIVDDIFDSGKTFEKISTLIDGDDFTFATIYARHQKNFPKQLLFGKLVTSDDYLVFPWDKIEFFGSEKLNLR